MRANALDHGDCRWGRSYDRAMSAQAQGWRGVGIAVVLPIAQPLI
jgi:hypothetical protein